MQHCAPIVTGEISKEFIGECWTYSISVPFSLKTRIPDKTGPIIQNLIQRRYEGQSYRKGH